MSERLERYGLISDVRLKIEKLANLSEMIDGYINIARKLSRQFDIILAKELFSSVVINEFEVILIVSLGGEQQRSSPVTTSQFYNFDKVIIQNFRVKSLRFSLNVL